MGRSGLRRRHFLLATGAAFAAALSRFGQAGRARAAGAFGPLVPDPDGIFDLPAGFRYRILDQFGDPMDDGYVVPAKPDGMATFPGPDGTVILMRNHELLFGDGPYPPESRRRRRTTRSAWAASPASCSTPATSPGSPATWCSAAP